MSTAPREGRSVAFSQKLPNGGEECGSSGRFAPKDFDKGICIFSSSLFKAVALFLRTSWMSSL